MVDLFTVPPCRCHSHTHILHYFVSPTVIYRFQKASGNEPKFFFVRLLRLTVSRHPYLTVTAPSRSSTLTVKYRYQINIRKLSYIETFFVVSVRFADLAFILVLSSVTGHRSLSYCKCHFDDQKKKGKRAPLSVHYIFLFTIIYGLCLRFLVHLLLAYEMRAAVCFLPTGTSFVALHNLQPKTQHKRHHNDTPQHPFSTNHNTQSIKT